ncbi:MAG TPA: membrane protein insertion efficiency factor YidD [Terriglobales bacterium]|nr:membrane protein insertion efficiency factor YidD [Terriglobales bacterium]
MKKLLQLGLRFYKRMVSPMLPGACRFVPTCSEYAAEAVEHHGAFRGSAMALWRLLRCQPLARGGYDPVPWADHRVCNSTPQQSCDPKRNTGHWQPRAEN